MPCLLNKPSGVVPAQTSQSCNGLAFTPLTSFGLRRCGSLSSPASSRVSRSPSGFTQPRWSHFAVRSQGKQGKSDPATQEDVMKRLSKLHHHLALEILIPDQSEESREDTQLLHQVMVFQSRIAQSKAVAQENLDELESICVLSWQQAGVTTAMPTLLGVGGALMYNQMHYDEMTVAAFAACVAWNFWYAVVSIRKAKESSKQLQESRENWKQMLKQTAKW